jgi:O-antigen ligase
MGTGVSTLAMRDRIANFLQQYLVPLGWLIILTSMFIAGDRGRVHQLFYVFTALPTLLYLILRPGLLKPMVTNPLFLAFALFSVYMLITLGWSTTDDSVGSLMKRPFWIALLMFTAGIITFSSTEKFDRLTQISALVAVIAGGLSSAYFMYTRIPDSGMRLEGYGALYNPLLSAHVFGAFATFWLAKWLHGQKVINPIPMICVAVLVFTILATGSRTPLVGLAAAILWLLATGDRQRGLVMLALIEFGIILVLIVHPESITQRGVSYRPEIWMESLRQISEHPWFGHGYDSKMTVIVPGLNMILADPHNMELGVLYAGGAIGLLLWIFLYGVAFKYCWEHRIQPAVSLAGAWLVFGLGSGMTEGMAFLSRPKEHWYLIWIPMALLFGQWVANDYRKLKLTGTSRSHEAP